MENSEKGLVNLKVWQRAIKFAGAVQLTILPLLPKDEQYALSLQLRRAAQSIPANLAEGYGRYYYQEGVRFCYVARGSLEECYSHLTLAHQIGYLADERYSAISIEIEEIRKMINGYIAYLKRSKRGADEPGAGHAVAEPISDYLPDQSPTDPVSPEP